MQNARRAHKIRLCGHLRRYKKIVKKTYIISITNICLDSGFESQRTFNRVFKERYKISPSDYRSTCVKEMLS